MSDDDDRVVDMQGFRDARRDRSEVALIQLFAGVLGQPLERRDLTPEQQVRREMRLKQRRRQP